MNLQAIESLLSEINALSTLATYSIRSVFTESGILQINFNNKLWLRSTESNCIILLQAELAKFKNASDNKVQKAIECLQYQLQHNNCTFAEALEIAEDSYVLTQSEVHALHHHPYNYHFYINGDLADGTEDYMLQYFGSMHGVTEYASKYFKSFVLIINTTYNTSVDNTDDNTDDNNAAYRSCARYNNYVYSAG